MRRLAALAWAALTATAAWAQAPFTFGVIGDTPYFAFEEAPFVGTLRALAEARVAFVVHVGDIKSGHAACTDELLRHRRDLLDASPAPAIFTPGDNDWSDCHRDDYDPVERLAYLRTIFYPASESLGQRRIPLTRQARRPENARWTHGGIVFATLNVPGSRNNLRMPEEHRARMQDNLAWVMEAVGVARRPEMRGLVLFMQADPDFGSARDNGYGALRKALGAQARLLGKPLLLVHGDGHRYRFDRPLDIPNFQRLETPGSPVVGAVIVSVDPEGAARFVAEQFSLGTAGR